MVDVIDLRPPQLNLELYAGDGTTFRITVTDVDDNPVDLIGTIKAQIRANRLPHIPTPDVNPVLADFDVDLTDAATGIVRLSLTGVQTQALVTTDKKFVGVWDCEWDPTGEQPRTICQGKVECLADVTRP